jgi:hypothetical protein
VVVAQRVGDVAQQPRSVEGDDFDTGAEDRAALLAVPVDLDHSRRLIGHQ